jgi:hypothetical protein
MVQITGTPTMQGTFTFTLQATDSGGHTATAVFTITVGLPPVPIGPVTPKRWLFLLAQPQPDGTPMAAITQAQSRRFTVRQGVGSYHEVSFDINGEDPAVAGALPLASDVQVLLDGQVLLVSRLGAEDDDLDGSRHLYTPTALDYREVLRRRDFAYGGDGPQWAAQTDVADIAWALIRNSSDVDGNGHAGVQHFPGGNLGIARGVGAGGTGVTTVINYIRQSFAGQEIDNLAGLGAGFDWDVTAYGQADLRLDVWPGQWPSGGRGQDRGVVLAYGGALVASMHRTFAPDSYANSVLVTGQHLSAATTVEAGSNGGTISNIGSWSAPSAGVLDVADSSQFTPSGQVQVHCSGHTNAIVSYTGLSSGGRFTGCQYVSGSPSGTVSTGDKVAQVPLVFPQVDAADIATRPEGRWDAVFGTSLQLQDPLTKAGPWYLAASQAVLPSWTIVLAAGAWQGPGHVWLGDTVHLWVKSGRLQVQDALPVTEMSFAIDSNDYETVTLTAGRPLPTYKRRIRLLDRRLSSVESR